MAEKMTTAERNRQTARERSEARADAFENRFICGDWAIFAAGDGLNIYLQPAANVREDERLRTYWPSFEAAVEFGLLPRLTKEADKRTVKSILGGYSEMKAEVLRAVSHLAPSAG